MSKRALAFISGTVAQVTGVCMLGALAVTLVYREWGDAIPLLLAAATAVAAGTVARRAAGAPGDLSHREAFAAVALAWLGAITLGALPYLFTGSMDSITNAVFESASGFTATGSTVVEDPASLPHGVLFWRALTQWLGGMGIVVLVVAFLPRLGVGGHFLTEAEAPGPTAERITPRFSDTARILWLLFVGFTAAQAVLLMLGGMTLFEAVTHSFTTVSGGGFGTDARSMNAFSAYAQWVVVVFMIVGGTSFALHHRGVRNPLEYLRNAEFRLFMWFVAAASAFVMIGTWGGAIHDTIRDAVFTVTSIITTTGFVTADFALWAIPLHVLLVGLMFVGAMAGSTSGSVKVYRLEVIGRSIRATMRRLVHPHSVAVVSVGGTRVSDRAVGSIASYFLLYVLTFLTGTIVLAILFTISGGQDIGLATTASAVATTLGNIGPGLDAVGPTTTFLVVPAIGKWLLSFLMVVGRLEILPVVMLMSPEAWRRR